MPAGGRGDDRLRSGVRADVPAARGDATREPESSIRPEEERGPGCPDAGRHGVGAVGIDVQRDRGQIPAGK